VAVIGNGNVAIDVARVLAKSADEMAKVDIVPEAGTADRRRRRSPASTLSAGADPSTPRSPTTNWPRWGASRVRAAGRH